MSFFITLVMVAGFVLCIALVVVAMVGTAKVNARERRQRKNPAPAAQD